MREHVLILLLVLLRFLARVPSSDFGELVLPRTVDVFAYDSTSFGIGKAYWVLLELFLVLSLVLKQIQNGGT